MGRTYWFECSRCGYRAAVCGGPDAGKDLAVKTVSCRECKKLYDAVVKWRVPAGPALQDRGFRERAAPAFQQAVSRLFATDIARWRWQAFEPRCPVAVHHRVALWQDPGKCPVCGVYMERNALPFRLWD